jgi:hypothetical protein
VKLSLRSRILSSPWLIPWVGLALVSAVDDGLVDLVGFDNAAGMIAAFGALLGAAWYLASPRPLAERLYPFAVLAVVLGVVMLSPGWSGGHTDLPGVFALPGILVGLVIAECHARPQAADVVPVTVERTR